MDLVTRLAAPTPARKQFRLVLDQWADTLPENEREAVYAAAANREWGHVGLRDVLVEAGAPRLSDNAVRNWRVRHGWSA